MPWGWGFRRGGYRFWAQATGMPGWMRAYYGLPAYLSVYTGYGAPAMSFGFVPGWGRGWFRGNPFGFCRWFPWLPRWWWSGIYGPVQWTPVSEADALKQEKQMLLDELKYIEERLKELGGKK